MRVPARPVRVTVVPDFHAKPGIDSNRASWIGRHIAAQDPDRVVIIGDFGDFGSVCFHERNDTAKGRLKPVFQQDLDAHEEAQALLHEGMANCRAKVDIVMGNHEERVMRFENASPEVGEFMREALYNLYRRFHWSHHPFGKFVFVGGVGFVHVPLGLDGKPIQGLTAHRRIAGRSVHDIVMGHTHKLALVSEPKLGENNLITVYDVGCAYPQGYVPPYVGNAASGWAYGVVDMTIAEGRVQQFSHTAMSELMRRYA